ncbi:alpha-L-rhamnosidase [Mucilaginibacter gossypiicola]|uniref:Alpha-L-rhamnosidase n=1 Tax=Mucilaginibacter gossypiicola TaxID=551995 RepID=A0A1H8BG22_9SPHI|nr:glycosyl hydrolase [Mucilaginibacter gossypiicola]SEM81084.1 alpha-L-rhamnosidase [Mucilaginibacter gossypiicola]
MNAFRKLIGYILLLIPVSLFAQEKSTRWFPIYDFNPATFHKPSIQFAPFARWWWPGNFVDSVELKREINLFADHDFGGMEIQPLNFFIPGTPEAKAKIVTWDTPDYYANVAAVMREARKRGLTIDMTDGSGWPPGGPFLKDEDGFITLAFAEKDVTGGDIAIVVPSVANNTSGPSHLEAVLAVKTLSKKGDDKNTTVSLDPKSIIVLTSQVKKDSLYWNSPAGSWKIIAFWSKPQGEKTMAATPVQGPVVNHLDSAKVLKSYRHLFGERTGLKAYFGNPMRAVFDDSYEFAVDRFFSHGFIEYFKKHRGYDITPWLPAEMQKKYNYVDYMNPHAAPDFTFSKEDWRLKYDYDLTVSELFTDQFLDVTKNWLEPQGLLHRAQSYGFNLDMIAAAGHASIPETESMLGPEANVKIMTSGGHLYNKPIISSESVVFNGRAYTNTPQKIKVAVDKLFAVGVNQIIYHGVPYRYTPKDLGPEGWYAFSTPLISAVNFSSNLGEGNIFWKDQKQVNEYINRTQYALRSGKAHVDVLIYFPFMDVNGLPANPEEILADGYLANVEGPLPTTKEAKNATKEAWAAKVYPLINQLYANGITWDWVNDESIQKAELTNEHQINIRGNSYQSLILADDSVIQLKTAQKIRSLAANGMRLAAMGQLPQVQPSYLDWQRNDKLTSRAIKAALRSANSQYLGNSTALTKWIKGLRNAVKFNGEYHFTREVQRDMTDGSRIEFIWNKSDQWQTLSLSLDKKYKSSYWMNADEGTTIKNSGSLISYRMPPYGSIILYASTKYITTIPAQKPPIDDRAKKIITVDQWDLKTDSLELKNSPLFDWRMNDKLKFSSSEGIYTSSFQWDNIRTGSPVYLDLGKVYYTAEVYINGKFAGKRLFAPYMLDIGPFLISGDNKIEVRVTTGQLNGFIGKAKQGDVHYKQFKGKEDQTMAAGLAGPVVISEKQ